MYLRRIEQINPKLNAVVTLAPDALQRAREMEAAVMRGDEVGPLHGVPLTIKDTIETGGLLTTSGSRLRESNVPREDAPTVASLKGAGAILLGKTNVPEMAIPYECDNPVFGRTNNPFDATRTSGGSSGGEAAAISACLTPAGLGSDLSGSIRVPAHFCGIAGLKPTTGRVPSEGHFPPTAGAFALGAVIGPMARYVEDLSLMLDVLSSQGAAGSFHASLKETGSKAQVNLWGTCVASFVDEERAPLTVETRQAVQKALRALEESGLVIVSETPPALRQAIDLWPALFSRASLNQLRETYAGHAERAGAIVRGLLASAKGKPDSPDEFEKAKAERDALRASLDLWMKRVPLVVSPVGSAPAFEHGARQLEVEGEMVSVFRAYGYSRAANVLGLPSVSIPVLRSGAGLPVGVQIIGRPFEEETLLAAASIIEGATGGWVPPQAMFV